MFLKFYKSLSYLALTLMSAVVNGQEEFFINYSELEPEFITSHCENSLKKELYSKSLEWINTNGDPLNLTIEHRTENQEITFTQYKSNGVRLDKQYYNVRYTVELNFMDNLLLFHPTKMELKLNSKYDMGWKEFDFNNTAVFYKKGKVIKKYKRYLDDLVSGLNELNIQLHSHLRCY